MLGNEKTPHPAYRGDFIVYKRGQGGWVSGKLWYSAWHFVPEGYAVAGSEKGWVLIDRKENIIGKIDTFDNTPDAIQEGFVRMTDGKKVRYFSLESGRYLKGQWDYASPFHEGIACVCNNCKQKIGDKDEYYEVTGGDGWVIDRKGKILNRTKNATPRCSLDYSKNARPWIPFQNP